MQEFYFELEEPNFYNCTGRKSLYRQLSVNEYIPNFREVGMYDTSGDDNVNISHVSLTIRQIVDLAKKYDFRFLDE